MTLRVLLVDDSAVFARAARAALERGGIDVLGPAITSADALAQVVSERPDVVLVDVHLGEESGFELVRRLAEPGTDPATLVLMSSQPEAELEGLLANSAAAGFLSKLDLSAATVREVHERSRSQGTP